MFSTECLDTPPPRPSRPQTYSFPETFRNAAQKGSPAMFFGTGRQKNSTKNGDIFLLSIKFSNTRNQWHSRGFPYEFFGTVRQNIFGRKFWYSPPSFSSTKLFATGNVPKRSSKGFPCIVFWHCETKNNPRKSSHIPFRHKIFRSLKPVTP